MVPVTIARAHNHLSGAGYDLPEVKPVFEAFIAQHGLQERLKFLSGNFFTDPLPTADVLIMGHILHDWDLAQKRMLLEKAHAALPKGGALIVSEAIIDDERRQNAFGLLMSLNMLIETTGGFDFTGADCQAWMREAGFSQTRVEPLAGPELDGRRDQIGPGRCTVRGRMMLILTPAASAPATPKVPEWGPQFVETGGAIAGSTRGGTGRGRGKAPASCKGSEAG